MNLDHYDRVLEEKWGYKKADERPGQASYIQQGMVHKVEDNKVLKMNVKRVDLDVTNGDASMAFYRSDSVCPYGSRHCTAAVYESEAHIFFKKLKKLKRNYKIHTLKRWFVRKILRRRV